MPEVSIVIVNMNRPGVLKPCLDSIQKHTKISYETWVVAYFYSPENLASLREDYPWVTVVESHELRGFSENNNLALRHARGKYCFIVNDDTWMEMPVIDALVADFEKLPGDVAAISPKIVFPDGRVQTCGRAPWTARRYMLHYLHWLDETRPSRWSMKDGLFQTYTLNGACFLIKTDIFKESGWFDERYFFTPEDIALGHRLNAVGRTVWADADVLVTHLAGGTVSTMEQTIKPARVRGDMIFYGEPVWLKCFIWCFEALRVVKYLFLPRTSRNVMMKQTALNVQKTVFSQETPKEVFIRFLP